MQTNFFLNREDLKDFWESVYEYFSKRHAEKRRDVLSKGLLRFAVKKGFILAINFVNPKHRLEFEGETLKHF